MSIHWQIRLTSTLMAIFCLLLAGISAGLFPETAIAAGKTTAPVKSGYLCCNMRVYNDWISDINYRFDGTAIIPPGTKAWVRETGRYSFTLAMAGKTRSLGNDYSRSLPANQFLARYLVKTSPRELIRTWDQDIQDAVRRMRIMVGMTEIQVLTSLGYPPHNYTPDLKSRQWKYWLDRSSEFTIHWTKDRTVRRIETDRETRLKITHRPRPEAASKVAIAPTAVVDPVQTPQTPFGVCASPTPVLTPGLTEAYQELRSSRSFMKTER